MYECGARLAAGLHQRSPRRQSLESARYFTTTGGVKRRSEGRLILGERGDRHIATRHALLLPPIPPTARFALLCHLPTPISCCLLSRILMSPHPQQATAASRTLPPQSRRRRRPLLGCGGEEGLIVIAQQQQHGPRRRSRCAAAACQRIFFGPFFRREGAKDRRTSRDFSARSASEGGGCLLNTMLVFRGVHAHVDCAIVGGVWKGLAAGVMPFLRLGVFSLKGWVDRRFLNYSRMDNDYEECVARSAT